MWRKFRFRFNLKISWTLGKISDKKSLSIQEERNTNGTKKELSLSLQKFYKEGDVKGSAWGKVAEKLNFLENGI